MPNPDERHDGGKDAGDCAFDALCWVVFVLLMVACGGCVLLAAALSLGGMPPPAVGAALAAAGVCALTLVMILVAFFALRIRQWCFAAHEDPATPGTAADKE